MCKRLWAVVLTWAVLLSAAVPVSAAAGDTAKKSTGISAKSAVLIEASTGRVLFAKDDRRSMSMASTTKIMTALLALEQPGLDDLFEVDANAIRTEGTSMGLCEGDQVSMRTLAYGMLLSSGNDAANAAAVRISGSIAAFADVMNQKAADLGLEDTHFCTPSGLDAEGHYSTAFDMAKLAAAALQNPDFKQICASASASVSFGNPPYRRTLKNHNRLLREYAGAIGVKTGFTKKSGRCLVSAAERGGVTLVAVTLNAPDDWQDHKTMLDYGFSIVKLMDLDIDSDRLRFSVVGGERDSFQADVHEDLKSAVTAEDLARVEVKTFTERFFYAPIARGQVVGTAEYWLDGRKIAAGTLVALEDIPARELVPPKGWWAKLKEWLGM